MYDHPANVLNDMAAMGARGIGEVGLVQHPGVRAVRGGDAGDRRGGGLVRDGRDGVLRDGGGGDNDGGVRPGGLRQGHARRARPDAGTPLRRRNRHGRVRRDGGVVLRPVAPGRELQGSVRARLICLFGGGNVHASAE